MTELKIKHILILVFAVVTSLSNAQLTTSTALSPAQLVQDVLVGGGVNVTNISYTGSLNAIGSFNATNTNLGLNSGIVLTTGTVLDGDDGPQGPNDTGSSGTDNDEPGYFPLTNIASEDTENAAVLEFDFTPQSDTVRFKYVFGSEEYPEFVDAGYNDVFAFFISGPGFGGDFNMATIPGTGGTAVTIDNVNAGSNSSFFVDNGDGSQSPQDGSNFYIQYDGFTSVIEAVAKVSCGETYHLKVAIADVGDGAYDSGIFLEANSLSSYPDIVLTTSSTFNLPENRVAEGCESATVNLIRGGATANNALIVPITLSGTAVEGVDYSSIPSEISFGPGQTTATLNFDILFDGVPEGDETVQLEFTYPDACGDDVVISTEFTIFDVDPLEVTVPDIDSRCAGDEATLVPIVTGGVNEYTYLWDTGETTPELIVTPLVTTSYTVVVTDACSPAPVSATGTVNIPVYPPITIVISDDTTVLCPNTPVLLSAEPSGGEGTFTYSWMDNGVNVNNSPLFLASPMATTNYVLKVTDGCGVEAEEELLFTVTTPVLQLEMSPDQIVCPNQETEISVTASSGLGGYTYLWHHSQETTSSVMVKPPNSTNYTVSVEDGCHTYHIDGTTTVEVIKPNANFSLLSNNAMVGLPVYFQNHSTGSVAWNWKFDNETTSISNAPNTTFSEWGWHEVELVAINEIGCTDTISKTIYIKPEFYFYAPNTFTPDADRFNSTYKVSVIGAKEFEFMIFNRWGELIYQTTDIYFEWNGSYKGLPSPDGSYVYRTKVTDKEGYIHHHFGTINLLR